ncbi:MAG TPA: TadE/TadG family type IV pilus assembly protein [Candidatus Sulfotelmatobacter sp.]|nr:TadE/TadG family type IV pilus assembly protein [Candidatus Sulfotelmatobacter sp.]
MIQKRHIQAQLTGLPRGIWGDDRAAQLVEFAVALPLLVLFVVGIFDFSGAYTLKQKLTNVTRDAARVAASGPATDLSSAFSAGSAPASVIDAFNVIDNYLVANKINDCGVTASSVTSIGILTWQFKVTPSGSPPCGITLTINRGYVFPMTGTTPPSVSCAPQSVGSGTAAVGTCVSLQYTYSWTFGRVSSVLGSSTTLPSQISAIGLALNEN